METIQDTSTAGAGGAPVTQARSVMVELMANTRFRNVWIGSTLSLIGDVCFAVSLPWLILQMTGSGLALGSVMVALVAPRVLFLLLGGAISDRFAARNILRAAYSVQMLCVGLVALLVMQQALRLPYLYLLVFIFGVCDAFVTPALYVMLPGLVKREHLAKANSLIMSTGQICGLAGAAVVGLLIARWGAAFAFVVDALSYLYILLVLMWIPASPRAPRAAHSVRRAIQEGLRYVWQNRALRGLLVISACLNFCITGVNEVGFAALANFRFASPAFFGFLMTSVSAGTLAGLTLAGAWPRKGTVVATVVSAGILLSALLAAMALELPIWWSCIIAFGQGVVAGYVNIQVLTWLQTSVQRDMLGRVMSVLSFATLGVAPLSLVVSGFLASAHVNSLFLGAGLLLFVVTLCLFIGQRGQD